jgi:hypothetical protein
MVGIQIDNNFTDEMVERAIAECAEAHFAGNSQRLRQALLMGQCEHCKCVSDSLVRQVSEYLGRVDKTVKAVYQYEPAESPQDSQSEDRASLKKHTGINLVVWVDRKSAALKALIGTLEAVLSTSQRKIGCMNAAPGCFVFDVEMVSDQDVQERRGLGLFVESAYLGSRPVWKRTEPLEQPLPEKEEEPGQVRFELPDSFDPELVPESRLIEHALTIEKLPPEHRTALEHHLKQIKVILIRRMISDQLAYINIAKEWFTVEDLAKIHQLKIGFGRIGGKAAGMLLAAQILNEIGDETVRASIRIPESFFLGSDVMYIFMAMNGLMYWNDQKYKTEERIWAEYPRIREEFQAGNFPPEILIELKEILANLGKQPLIVRSSSMLEDNFGTAFAGKYDSTFCPNQGTLEENLQGLTRAIARTYASTLKPEALLYRRSKGLQDYDERMAILIQAVQGEPFGRYYLPHGAGVAFSHNLYRWSPLIHREAGFARLVWGLGTRAVERVGNDYPRPVALSHPMLKPDDSPEAIRFYSQRFVDLIDLEENAFKTVPVNEAMKPTYPPLRFIAQLYQEGDLYTPRSRVMEAEVPNLVITYDELLRRTQFASILSRILRLLEGHYHSAVDVEFTVHIPDTRALQPQVQISLLQCRPQSFLKKTQIARIPDRLTAEDIIFSTRFLVPQGYLPKIRHVLFVPHEQYFSLKTPEMRKGLGGVIAQLNKVLPERSFFCVGPGRWGTTNSDLGVYVCYSDICHSGALIEISGKGVGPAPEPSLGTHFFQDLMEAQIYPLAINLDDAGTIFNHDFFYNTPNSLTDWISCEERLARSIRLISVAAFRPGHHIKLVMDDEKGLAVAYLAPD